MHRKLIFTIVILLLPSFCFGGTYWVDTSGGAANFAACSGVSDVGAGNRCTLTQAKAGAVAGDIVYLMTGTYTVGLSFSNSGTSSSNRITFAAATGQSPLINPPANTTCLDLSGRTYIKISNISFLFTITGSTYGYLMDIGAGGRYNEVDTCTFDGGTNGQTIGPTGSAPGSINIRTTSGSNGAYHNWIHGCTFQNANYWVGDSCATRSVGMNIGLTTGTVDTLSTNNTIENNVFKNLGHHLLETSTKYNVIRNNVFHNEGQMDSSVLSPGSCETAASARSGLYGDRNVQIYDGANQGVMSNLFEGNRTGHAAIMEGMQEGNITITSQGNIIRYNHSYYSEAFGLAFKMGASSSGLSNRAYNNTLYYNGQDSQTQLKDGYTYDWRGGVGCHPSTTNTNILKNNIIYGSFSNRDIMNTGNYDCTGRITDTNNWKTANGDPLFTDTDVSDPTSTTLPDLTPSNASVRDGGTYLTQANGSGTGSTTLIVDDSTYFQAGSEPTCGSTTKTTSFGSCLSSIAADWICIADTGNCRQIADINHGTNTITLASSASWSSGDYVWLYKKSDGVQVLYGTAPDYGAFEYEENPDVTAPTISNLSPNTAQTCSSNPRNVTRTWNTDEAANCRIHATSSTWAEMSAAGTTGGTSHSDTASQACGASYTPYIVCQDTAENESAASQMSYSIAAEAASQKTVTIGGGSQTVTKGGGSLTITR